MDKGERFNNISHLIGAALALAGGAVPVILAAVNGDTRNIVSFSICALTLFPLDLVSTLHYSLAGPAKKVLQLIDHQAICLYRLASHECHCVSLLRRAPVIE